MTKTVSQSKMTEWEGLDRISAAAHAMNCIFREISKDDYGIDGEIEIVQPKDDGSGYETTGAILKVQAKSGVSYVLQDTEESFSTPVSRSDLDLWYGSNFPVLLIVYHPGDDKLYAKEVRQYIRTTPAVFTPPFRITYEKSTDEFGPAYQRQLLEHGSVSAPRLSFQEQEQVYTNLLPVQQLPKVYCCATKFKDTDALPNKLNGYAGPFTIADGKIWTLADLHHKASRLRRKGSGRITERSGQSMIGDAERRNDYRYLLNRLLGSHLHHCGIAYNRQHRRNYFPRKNLEDSEFKADWFNVRTRRQAPERILAKHYTYGLFDFWRHLACDLRFVDFGKSLYLQVVPRYFFTVDGQEPWDSNLVGTYTTQKKATEHNIHVLNHVLFWSYALSDGDDRINLRLFGKTIMAIDKTPLVGISPFAIPDDPATHEEEVQALQLNLFGDLEELEGDDES